MSSSTLHQAFYIVKDNIYAVPVLHYNMEMAAAAHLAFNEVKPDCVAVELAETMQTELIHAASRLPDISVVVAYDRQQAPLYYICEPCDAAFEALRLSLETNVPAFCIDLDVDEYPDVREDLPDPYAIQKIGLKSYYEAFLLAGEFKKSQADLDREMHMARRLKELSLSYDKVLFVGGMVHIQNIFKLIDRLEFPSIAHATRDAVQLCTLTDISCRDVLAEYGWLSMHYETSRADFLGGASSAEFPSDRQKIIYKLFKEAAIKYTENSGEHFFGYHMRNLMKFLKNYARITGRLMPDLYQMLSAAKACVDHNFAYETWVLATEYPFRKNVDNLPELDLSVEDVWKNAKLLKFHLKKKHQKAKFAARFKKGRSNIQFKAPGPFSICSYPPEDVLIERFGEFLKRKGSQILLQENARTIPFSTSIEDGIDVRETIRHWHEKKLFVKTQGKPPGTVGSIVIIFDEDYQNYPWDTTWIGESNQESDMSFYATHLTNNVVGPGISKCEYGGFMMTYPPRRLTDVWSDPDYRDCRSKAEVLLMSAIDYSVQPLITYVAAKPPRSALKSYASRYGKKIVYFPIGQLSPVTLSKLRTFHVLEGHEKRDIAGEYIF